LRDQAFATVFQPSISGFHTKTQNFRELGAFSPRSCVYSS
jgi:hypothetical protein